LLEQGLSQSEAAQLLGVTQPRISDLMRGKIELFGLDTLVNMIGAAGIHVEVRISVAAWSAARLYSASACRAR
jgi:predicted XRE-type DNA-binding protein